MRNKFQVRVREAIQRRLFPPSLCVQYADPPRVGDLIILIHIAKDSALERRILQDFSAVCNNPILAFDDLRLWNMLKIWRKIQLPKMGLTLLGHWCVARWCEWTGLPVFGAGGEGGM